MHDPSTSFPSALSSRSLLLLFLISQRTSRQIMTEAPDYSAEDKLVTPRRRRALTPQPRRRAVTRATLPKIIMRRLMPALLVCRGYARATSHSVPSHAGCSSLLTKLDARSFSGSCLEANEDALVEVVAQARAQFVELVETEQNLASKLVQDSATAQSILDDNDTFIFDCDGVLWSGALGLLPGVAATLARLAALGKRLLYVTNNSTKSRAAYAAKFQSLGLDVTADQIVPASQVAANWIKKTRPNMQAAYVIGSAGVEEELRAVGIEVVRSDAQPFDEAAFAVAEPDQRIGAVIVGSDPNFSFSALAMASLCLERIEGSLFVATNDDAFDLVGGRRLPGNGCQVAALQAACGRPPDAVCGKPSADLAEYLLSSFALDPARTIVVGDRCDTDIALAHAMKASSLLVLTGVATAADAAQATRGQPGCPSAVVSHLAAVLEFIVE